MSNLEKITQVSEINQLILQGKQKGYLTYEEVNDLLPSDVIGPEQIDDLMHLFGENKIMWFEVPIVIGFICQNQFVTVNIYV